MAEDAGAARALTAAEQGRRIAAGTLDPVELAEAYLEAIAAHPHGARIYARTTPERARAEAEAARARAREGRRLGPLDGVPVSWKDLFDTAGVATEAGSRLLAGRVPARDAEVVRRGTAAGTVCLGKTHLSELAFSGLGINPVTATPPNRHGEGLAPGGSSSGAAASLAFGLAPLAVGTDTGGSVRIPAAWNDLVGLKTTVGLVPTEGCVPLAPSLDTIGPLARTVEDAALGFAMLAGVAVPETGGMEASALRLHVAETAEGGDPAILGAFEDAVARLAAAGARVTRGPVPMFAEAAEVAAALSPVVNHEGWREWGAAIEANPGAMFPFIETRFRSGAAIPAEANARALEAYARLGAEFAAFVAEHGVVAMPTVPIRAPEVAALLADPALYAERNMAALRHTRLGNLLRTAALTVPTGVPMAGLMLVAGGGAEAALLRMGRTIERTLA